MNEKEDPDFIENNLYTGKNSKSIYKPLYTSLMFFLVAVILSVVFYNLISDYEKGNDIQINYLLWGLYQLIGKIGGVIALNLFGVFTLVIGYSESMKKKNIRDS